MAQKLFDAAVKTGEYVDGQGQTKGRYENIGTVMQGDNGMFLVLKRTFNPAGVPNPENKDSVLISFFEPKQQQQGGYNQGQQQQGYQQQQQSGYQQQVPQQSYQQQGGFAPQQGYNSAPQQQGGR